MNVNDLLAYSRTLFGRPYVYGATGPGTFDCSGYVQYVFHRFGVNLPRTSQQQASVGTPVSKTAIKAGDLIFSDWGDGPNSHVGIADGAGNIYNAPHTGDVVRSTPLSSSYLAHVTAVRRIAGVDGTIDPAAISAGAGALAGGLDSAASGDSIVGPLVQPLKDLASAAQSGAKVADLVTKAFLPSNFIRISAGLSGLVFILFGLLLLSREVRN